MLSNMDVPNKLGVRAPQGPDLSPNDPPAGIQPPPFSDDFEYPYSSLQHVGIALLFLFPALAIIVVLLRVRIRLGNKQFGWDDFFICLAMVNSMASTAVSYVGMRKSFLGVHVYDIPPQADPREGMKWAYFIQALYNPILALVKTSLLLFLLRLGGQVESVRWSIHALNAFNLALMVAIFVTVIFQCTPISYFWEQAGRSPPAEGFCIDKGAFYTSTAALTAVTDILVLAIPFRIFLGLQMRRKIKWAILGVFALGGVVTIISILRLVWLVETFFYPMPEDATYDIRFIYSAVETNLAIIAASAPVLQGLVGKWFPRIIASFRGMSKQTDSDRSRSTKNSRSTIGGVYKQRFGSHPTDAFQMKNIKSRSEIRSYSPTASEEEIMTYNGILRTREFQVSNHSQVGSSHKTRAPSEEEHNPSEPRSLSSPSYRGGDV